MVVINMSRVPGGAHGLAPQRLAAGLRRLRRGRRADRGRAPQAVLASCCSTRSRRRTPTCMELFYQVFDKGMLEDGEGREIDFKNTVILLTSNVGTDTIMKLCADPETRPEPEALAEALRPELLKIFKPALLGRMIVVPYYPLSDDVMRQIIKLQLGRIGSRLQENHGAAFSYDEAVIAAIAGRCTRGRERRAQRRPHPDADAAAGDVRRVPRPHGRRPDHLAGPRIGRRRRQFPLRVRRDLTRVGAAESPAPRESPTIDSRRRPPAPGRC